MHGAPEKSDRAANHSHHCAAAMMWDAVRGRRSETGSGDFGRPKEGFRPRMDAAVLCGGGKCSILQTALPAMLYVKRVRIHASASSSIRPSVHHFHCLREQLCVCVTLEARQIAAAAGSAFISAFFFIQAQNPSTVLRMGYVVFKVQST